MTLLQSGKVASRIDLTKHLGLSRARITQVLSVLTLAPEVLGLIEGLGDPLIAPIVTERFLRSVSALDEFEQMRRIEKRVLERIPRMSEEAQTSEHALEKPGATSRR